MSAGVLSKRWFFFFFSSRRRHTRLQGDWSSDVCSSDLTPDDPAEYSVSRDGVSDGLSAPARSRPRARADTSRRLAHVIPAAVLSAPRRARDRKSTRLNSSHLVISYAVFCLKKKSMMNAMRQAHADGWFIVFDTLTFADDRLEAFYDNPNALRDYFRDIARMVLAAEGRKANDSHADCYQYFCFFFFY